MTLYKCNLLHFLSIKDAIMHFITLYATLLQK